MLMAMSGLGCHYKHADVAYVPSCYTTSYDACYTSAAPACYSGCYSSAEYIGGCYSESCYSQTGYSEPWSSCYSERRGCFLKRIFHGGMFKKHHRAKYAPVETSCYSSCYSGCYSTVYDPPVFGSSMPIYETPYASMQAPSKATPVAVPAAVSAPASAPARAATPAAPVPAADTPPADPTPVTDVPAEKSAVEDAINSLDARGTVPDAVPAPPPASIQP
jgi:hypothetical protein